MSLPLPRELPEQRQERERREKAVLDKERQELERRVYAAERKAARAEEQLNRASGGNSRVDLGLIALVVLAFGGGDCHGW
jgi:hypothetical protein